VALVEDEVVGFAVLSKVSKREVYQSVSEFSVYLSCHLERSRGVEPKE